MNRQVWTQRFTNKFCPQWPCPTCKTGHLVLEQTSFVHTQTKDSKTARNHPDWDPDWIEYIFVAWAKCSAATCGERFAISGTGSVEQELYYDEDEGPSEIWSDCFYPRSCEPMPHIIQLPSKCPPDVKSALNESFRLYLRDLGASAAKIRIALEYLMNFLGMPRKSPKGGRDLDLHSRITQYAAVEATLGGQLMALKWLGNTATHEGRVAREDLLDAFEIVEHVLSEIIDRRSTKVAALAAKLTTKHSNKEKGKSAKLRPRPASKTSP